MIWWHLTHMLTHYVKKCYAYSKSSEKTYIQHMISECVFCSAPKSSMCLGICRLSSSVAIPVCERFGLWTFRFVTVAVSGPAGLWPFLFLAVSVCGRFGCGRFGVKALWPVTEEQASFLSKFMVICYRSQRLSLAVCISNYAKRQYIYYKIPEPWYSSEPRLCMKCSSAWFFKDP